MEGSTTKCNNFNVSSIEVVALGCGAFQISKVTYKIREDAHKISVDNN